VVLFFLKISDPYRCLENPDSEDAKKFVDDQNAISQPFLESTDAWNKINKKLTSLWNFEKYGVASKHGKKYFYSHNTGLQNQNVIFYLDNLSSESKLFLDPNSLSSDGTVALTSLKFTKDGSRVAYGLSSSGSDWVTIKFRNVETNEDFDDVLEYSKFFQPTWTHDNKGVFYGTFPVFGVADGCETNANENQKVYYHKIGDKQENDILVAEFPENPKWRFSSEVSDCGFYLIFYIMFGCNENLVYFADLRKTPEITGKLDFVKVVTKFKYDYEYITNDENIFYFRTNDSAPNYRIIAIDFNNPNDEWKTLIEEHPKNVLDWAVCVNTNKLVLHYMVDVRSALQVHSLKTGKFDFEFKIDYGCIQGFSGDRDSSEIFFQFVSFLVPGVVYHFNFDNLNCEPKIFKETKIPNFDREAYKVEQIFYPSSEDGEKIPMFIIRKNGKEIQPRPTLLYGYGGFGISLQPTFSVTFLAFIDMFDGTLAYANIRGGNEYGMKWHDNGRLLNKQNVFNDFQSGAKHLIENNYTTKEMLAIQGGSNGGLLVGACINQRPDLFGAAVAQVCSCKSNFLLVSIN